MELETVPARLTETAEALHQAADGIAEEVRVLAAAVTHLHTAWDGEAKEAFRLRHDAFQLDAAAAVDDLHQAATALGDLAQEYSDADRKAAEAQPGFTVAGSAA